MYVVRPASLSLLIISLSFLFLTGCNGVTSVSAPAMASPHSTEFVYTIANSSVAGFQVQPDATLRPITGLPSAGNLNQERLIESPDGKWLLTITGCPPSLCPDRGAVFSQAIQADGQLGAPLMVIPADQRIEALAVDQTSHFVYALTEAMQTAPVDPSTGCSGMLQTLNAYVLQSNGGLLPLASSARTVDGGFCPMDGSMPVTRMIGFHQDTTGNFLWLAQDDLGRGTDDPSLLSIPVATDGTLGAFKKVSISQFTQAEQMAIAGDYLITNENRFRMFISSDTVTTFHLHNGDFQFAAQCTTDVPACHGVLALAALPGGKMVYTISGASDATGGTEPQLLVNALALDSTTGMLTPTGKSISLPAGSIYEPGDFQLPPLATVDPQGRFLFISRNNDSTITAIILDSATGQLLSSMDSSAGMMPNAIVSVSK